MVDGGGKVWGGGEGGWLKGEESVGFGQMVTVGVSVEIAHMQIKVSSATVNANC